MGTRPLCAALLALAVLSGCGGGSAVAPLGRAPERGSTLASGMHSVLSGETLYGIAWQHGVDYQDLARWNGIGEPFTIRPGQRLRLSRPKTLPPVASAAPREPPRSRSRAGTKSAAPRPAPVTPPKRSSAPDGTAQVPATTAESTRKVASWRWPAKGKLVGRFGTTGGKGIDIENVTGTPIVAAAPGRVVYSGSGLRGYGRLIIVKHNKRYLSAYAHNERLHVKEGDTVSSGQRIADMGSTGTKSVKLHFEIRRDGKPVDPTRYLPR